ncbi:MAG: AsmA-like C-terminal domain-containing protein [Thermodesulfobacteriota bacterium]
MGASAEKDRVRRWRTRVLQSGRKAARKLAVWTLILLAVLLVLGAGLVAFAHIFPQAFAPALLSAAQKTAGLTIEDFSLSPLSILKFRLAGGKTTLSDPGSGLQLARARAFAVTLDLSGILRRRIAVDDLYLSEPRATLSLADDGSVSLGGMNLSGGESSRWKTALERTVVEDGAVVLTFPPDFSMPPLTVDGISAGFALPLLGTALDAKARVLWAGREGAVRISGKGSGKDYGVSFALSNIPLNGLTIPGDPEAFPDIPVSGSLSASGVIRQNAEKDLSGKLAFSFTGLCLNNRNAPDGKVLADPFSGSASFSYSPKLGLQTSGNVKELALAFSRFSGRFSLAAAPDADLSYAVSLSGKDFAWQDYRPYLTSFLEPETGRWLTERLADAQISNVQVFLRGPLTPADPAGGGPVFLRTSADVSGVTLWASEGTEPIRDIEGKLLFFTEHMEGHDLSARAPGAEVAGGDLSIIYGTLPGTPMRLSVKGRAETETLWPWVQSLVLPEGFLSRMGLSGPADVSFSWTTDLDGGGQDDFQTGVDARGMTVCFEKGGEHPLNLTGAEGRCEITPREVAFSGLTVHLADASATADGVFGTDDRTATNLSVAASGLNAVLPTYADPLHPIRAWLPKSINGRINLRKEASTEGVRPLRIPFVLTDEKRKTLSGELAFLSPGWSLSGVEGGLGAFFIKGNVGSNENGKIAVSINPPGLAAPFGRAQLEVTERSASLSASAGQLRLDEWNLWRIPEECRELFAWTNDRMGRPGTGDLPFRTMSVTASSSLVQVSEELAAPFSLAGMVHFGPELVLDAPRMSFGPRNLSFTYRSSDRKEQVRLTGRGGALPEYAALGRWAAGLAPRDPGGKGRELAATIVLANVTAPGVSAGSYTANVLFAPSASGYKLSATAGVNGSDLKVAARQNAGKLSISLDSHRLDLMAAAAAARALENPRPGPRAGQGKADLTVNVDKLGFSSDLAGPCAAKAALSWDSAGYRADVSRFLLFSLEGKATYAVAGDRGSLRLTLSELLLPDLLKRAKAAARTRGLDFAANGNGNHLSALDFTVDAPQVKGADGSVVPLSAAGTAVYSPGRVSVEANRFALGPQKGSVSVSTSENDLRIRGDFSFVDFQALDELINGKPAPEPEGGEKDRRGKKVAFAWDPPDRSIELSLSADTLKFWRTSFEDLRLDGRISPDRAVVSDLSWSKKKKQVFSLTGNMDRDSAGWWGYTAEAQFQDLGDVTKLLVSRQYKAKEHFPIQGGETAARITGTMQRGPDGLWIPLGTITFESKEGTIDVGGRFLMVLAALSPQNYLRAIAGERTELSGKGAVFKNMKGVLDYDGDKVTVSEFIFESPSLRYVADGTVDLEAYTENLHICMQPFESLNKIISYTPMLSWVLLNRDGAIFETCFRAEGDIGSPKVYALPQSMIPTRLQDLFDRK